MRKDDKRQVLLTVEERKLIEILRAYGITPEEVFVKYGLVLPTALKKAQ